MTMPLTIGCNDNVREREFAMQVDEILSYFPNLPDIQFALARSRSRVKDSQETLNSLIAMLVTLI